MKMKFLSSLRATLNLTKLRQKIQGRSATEIPEDFTTKQARLLHPGSTTGKLIRREKEGSNAYRLTFSSESIPLYESGSYVTLRLSIGESLVSRPYSLVTDGETARSRGEIEIIVRDDPKGFVAPYLCHGLPLESEVGLEIGLGQFHYDRFRDAPHLVALAGGVGITPFLSFARYLHGHGDCPYDLTIIHGSLTEEDIIGKEELKSLECPRLKVVDVISDGPSYPGEKGFIDADILKRYSPEGDVSYFLCGSEPMRRSLLQILREIGVKPRRIRMEAFSPSLVSSDPDYPVECLGKTVKLTVVQGNLERVIDARCDEPIATALERAGIYIHTGCRNGECGMCRIHLLEGEVYVPKEKESRRYSDREFRYYHGCVTYPLSDAKIKINVPPKD